MSWSKEAIGCREHSDKAFLKKVLSTINKFSRMAEMYLKQLSDGQVMDHDSLGVSAECNSIDFCRHILTTIGIIISAKIPNLSAQILAVQETATLLVPTLQAKSSIDAAEPLLKKAVTETLSSEEQKQLLESLQTTLSKTSVEQLPDEFTDLMCKVYDSIAKKLLATTGGFAY